MYPWCYWLWDGTYGCHLLLCHCLSSGQTPRWKEREWKQSCSCGEAFKEGSIDGQIYSQVIILGSCSQTLFVNWPFLWNGGFIQYLNLGKGGRLLCIMVKNSRKHCESLVSNGGGRRYRERAQRTGNIRSSSSSSRRFIACSIQQLAEVAWVAQQEKGQSCHQLS